MCNSLLEGARPCKKLIYRIRHYVQIYLPSIGLLIRDLLHSLLPKDTTTTTVPIPSPYTYRSPNPEPPLAAPPQWMPASTNIILGSHLHHLEEIDLSISARHAEGCGPKPRVTVVLLIVWDVVFACCVMTELEAIENGRGGQHCCGTW